MNKSLLKDSSCCFLITYLSHLLLLAMMLPFLFGCTTNKASVSNNDPFEPTNRRIHAFNLSVDKAVAKPVAEGYTKITPDFIEKAVSNFSSNLGAPAVAINQFLQGNIKLGIEDSMRFVFNSTLGLGGLIDISTPMGLAKHEEDFGQTLAVWGMGSGPHLSVPFFGPSNVRDGAGRFFDLAFDPLSYLEDDGARTATDVLLLTDKRAALLGSEELLTGDTYLLVRDAYNQRRDFLIKNGEVEDSFLDGVEE